VRPGEHRPHLALWENPSAAATPATTHRRWPAVAAHLFAALVVIFAAILVLRRRPTAW